MNNKSLTRRIVKGIVALLLVASLGTITYIRATEEPMGTTSIEEIEHRDGKAVAATDVQRRDFASYIRADGTVRAPERYVLRSNISEKVQRVPVDVGDAVEPGEILVQLRKDDIKSEIEAASTRFKEARKNYERYTNLLERGVVSADTVEARRTAMKEARSDLTRANSRMKFTTIRAPEKSNLNYNGDNVMVTHRHVDPGEFKGSGEPLVTLADMSRMEIKATAPQQAMKYLSRGEEMNFRLEGEDEWQRAPIRRISPGTEDPHRFFRVYAATDNDGNRGEWRIRPGMYAEVRLLKRESRNAVAVPASALSIAEDGCCSIFRLAHRSNGDTGDGSSEFIVRKIEVETGMRDEEMVEILSPELPEDSAVVVNPRMDLRDGDRVVVDSAE